MQSVSAGLWYADWSSRVRADGGETGGMVKVKASRGPGPQDAHPGGGGARLGLAVRCSRCGRCTLHRGRRAWSNWDVPLQDSCNRLDTCRTLLSPMTSTHPRPSCPLARIVSKHPQAQGASSYILDLRNNPGGLVRASIDIARLWMDGNPVVFNISGREVRGREGMLVAVRCA